MGLEVIKDLPKKESKKSSLLFIHGINHGAWCWKENFLPYFSSKGFPSYALSLRGHGNSTGYNDLHSYTINHYMLDVLNVMKSMNEKPVLIGHSLGGGIVQKLLQFHQDKIKAIVLMAPLPPEGMMKDFIRLFFIHFKKIVQAYLFNQGKNISFPTGVFFLKNCRLKKEKNIPGSYNLNPTLS